MASKQPVGLSEGACASPGVEGVLQGVARLDLSREEKKRIHSDLAFVIQRKLLDTDFEDLKDHLLCRDIIKDDETYRKFIHVWKELEKQNRLDVGKYDFLKEELRIIGQPDILEIIKDFEDDINGVSQGQSQKWLRPGRSHPAGSSESKPSGGGNIQGIQAKNVTLKQTFNITESREVQESQSDSNKSPSESMVPDVRPKQPTGNAAPGAAQSSKVTGTHVTTEDECIRLVAAAYRGDLDTVIRLLNGGVSVNQPRPEDQRTAIFQAAAYGHLQVVNELLRRGAEMDSQNKNGSTALIVAAQEGYLDCVGLLLDKGADINHSNKDGTTAFLFAANNGHLDCVKLLLDKGVDVNQRNKETAIWKAAFNGHSSVVKELVKQGADVDSQKENGSTAFIVAAQEGHLDCVQLLFDKGADINHSNKSEATALHLAAQDGHLDVTKYLVQNGAEVSALDENEATALYNAAYYGHLDVAKYLVRNGADADARTKDDLTALHASALQGHLDVTKFLVQNGAQVHARDKCGDRPDDYARKEGHKEVENYLKSVN